MPNSKKIILVVILLVVLLTPVYSAHALFGIGNAISSFAESAVGRIFYYISYLFALLGSAIFAFAAFLTRVALNLNLQLFNPQNQLLTTGWTIVRDLANLGFVLVIIVIGIATILRIEQYGVNKLLPKLIAAAIIVNFSMAIAGFLIDFSNVLTNFFIEKTTGVGNTLELADSLAGAFNAQGLLSTGETRVAENSNLIEVIMAGFLNLIFIVIFTLTASFAMLAIALMFILRYLWLTFLIILSPIVWLFWVFPALEGQFKNWWHKFLQWVFFAPAASFFIYLALLSTRALSYQNVIYQDSAGKGFFGEAGETLFNIVSKGAQMTVLVGILVGGLIVSQKMGITTAAGAVGLVNKAGGAVKGWAGRQALRTGRSLVDRARTTGREYNPATKETTTGLQRFGSRLQGVVGLKGVGSFIARQGAIVPEKRPEDIEKYRKENFEALTHEAIVERATSRGTFLNLETAAALGQEIAKRYAKMTPAQQTAINPLMPRFVETAERMGNAQTIYSARPDLVVPRPGETPEQALTRVMKDIKVADITNITHEVLGDAANPAAVPIPEQINATLNLSNGHLGKLGTEGKTEQTEAIRNTVRHLLFTPGALAALSPQQVDALNRIQEFIDNSPNWQNL